MPFIQISSQLQQEQCDLFCLFVSKAEEKMKDNNGISSSRLKMSFIFERRIQQLKGKRFFFLLEV